MANKKVKIELTAVNKTKAAFGKVTSGLKGVGGAAKTASKAVAGVGLAAVGVGAALAVLTKKSLDYVDAIGKTAKRTGISTDLLQAFQQGAIEAGSSIEAAQKGLEKFTRSVGDASRGLKTQADIFKDMGVQIFDTNGDIRDMTDILFETADGIAAFGSEATKATALANLFGRSGTQFQEIFKGGAEGIKDFIEQGKQLGFIIGADGIATVEKLNDVMSQIKASAAGLANQLVVALAPAFLAIADALKSFIIEQAAAVGGFDDLGKSMAVAVIEAVRTSVTALAELLNSLNKVTQLDKVFGNIFVQLAKLRGFELEFIPYETVINVDKVNASLDVLVDKVKTSDFVAKEFLLNMGKGMNDLGNPLQNFITQIDDVNKSIGTAAAASMKKMEDTIMDGLKNGKLAFEDFATFVVDQLLRIAIQQMIIAPMSKALFGSIPTFDGGGYTGMGSRAGGVDGKGGFPAVLHPNETVVDHTKGQGMNSGANITFNIQANDAAGFDQLLNSRKQMITAMINNAMNNRGKMGVV